VVDFGLAKLTQHGKSFHRHILVNHASGETGTGVVMGTTAYMSPEQAAVSNSTREQISGVWVWCFMKRCPGSAPFKGDTQSDLIVSILET
jgi:serine/threonine protein kinase